MAKLVAILPNKVGLDKEYAAVQKSQEPASPQTNSTAQDAKPFDSKAANNAAPQSVDRQVDSEAKAQPTQAKK